MTNIFAANLKSSKRCYRALLPGSKKTRIDKFINFWGLMGIFIKDITKHRVCGFVLQFASKFDFFLAKSQKRYKKANFSNVFGRIIFTYKLY